MPFWSSTPPTAGPPPRRPLAFLPLALGHFFGFLTRWHDHRRLSRRRLKNETIEPETKLFWFAFAAPRAGNKPVVVFMDHTSLDTHTSSLVSHLTRPRWIRP